MYVFSFLATVKGRVGAGSGVAIMDSSLFALIAGFCAVIVTQIYLYFRFKAELYNQNLELAAAIKYYLENIGSQIDIEPPTPGQMLLMELVKSKMSGQLERDEAGKFV